MTDVAGGFKALGEGLFAMAGVQIRKEEDEIAHMRTKALQELGFKHDKEMTALQHQNRLAEGEAAHERGKELFGMETAARRGDVILADELATKRQGQEQSFELRMQARRESFAIEREKVKSLDELKSLMSSTLRGLDSDLRDARKAKLDYIADAKNQGIDPDPNLLAQYDAPIQALTEEKVNLRASFKASLASYSGIKPAPDPKAELGSEERTRAMSRQPTKAGMPIEPPAAPAVAPPAPAAEEPQLFDAVGVPPKIAPTSTVRSVGDINTDPKAVRTFMEQVETLKAAGQSKSAIRQALGSSYGDDVFKTYLGW